MQLDPVQRELREIVMEALAAGQTAATVVDEVELVRLTLPHAGGGYDLGQASAVVVAEELGGVADDGGYLDAVATAELLVAHGDGGLAEDIAAGRLRPVVASSEGPARVRALPRADGSIVLDGEAGYCFGAPQLVAVAANGPDGGVVAMAEAGPSVVVRPCADCGDSDLYSVELRACRLPPSRVLPVGTRTWPRDLLATRRVRHAAFLVGIAAEAVAAGTAYARSRVQFGSHLSDFQLVGARLAEHRVRVAVARLLVHDAAARYDAGEDAAAASAQALATACETVLAATRGALQVQGAHGLTTASSIQRSYRAALVQSLRLGRPDALWQEVGAARLAATARPAAASPAPVAAVL